MCEENQNQCCEAVPECVREMELSDTIEMMVSADYKERFKAEYHQLNIRCRKLSEFLTKYESGELSFTPSCTQELLRNQLDSMKAYRNYLVERAKIESAEL